MKRRDILKSLTLLPLAGGVMGAAPLETVFAAPAASGDLFEELGVRTFINAAGTYTFMTGSLMHDYVLDAINASSKDFCLLSELMDKVGERIAKMCHAEAAMVSAGAFSGLTLGMAGILTGMDEKKVTQLPNLEGMKSEVICQKAHDIEYNQAMRNCGVKIIAVETVEDLEKAINEKTASMHFLNILADKGQIKQEQWVAIAKKHNIPTSIDMAADVPPVSNLWKFNEMGFDVVVVSGGKAIRGPQSAGILMGKKEIIAAARLNAPPNGETIGRGMKVNKEEILGMYVALKRFISLDHEKELQIYHAAIAKIENAAKSVKGVTSVVSIPVLGNVTPTLDLSWDSSIKLTGKQLSAKLLAGNPSVGVISKPGHAVQITAWMLKPGQEVAVAKRLKEELAAASV